MDAWIDMYNQVLSVIKKGKKRQTILLNKPLKYNEMNLDNLTLNKLKKDLHKFKKELVKNTRIDSDTLDNCINDVLTMLSSSITNLNQNNVKKRKLRYIKKSKKSKIIKIENNGMTITETSFCTSKLGKVLNSNPLVNYKNKNSTYSTIQYVKGKLYMLIINENNKVKTSH